MVNSGCGSIPAALVHAPEFPRWHRLRIGPQPAPLRLRLLLRVLIAATVARRLFIRIGAVMPGHSGAHLRQPRIAAMHCQLADQASVAILLVPNHPDLFAQHQPGQMISCLAAVGLVALRCVDAAQAHLVFAAATIPDHHAVAVIQKNHFAMQHGRRSKRACQQWQQKQYAPPPGTDCAKHADAVASAADRQLHSHDGASDLIGSGLHYLRSGRACSTAPSFAQK